MSHKIIKLSPLVLAAAAASISTQAYSSGFALIEQGASGQGVAYAGAAAVGEDASTIFFNPAAMTRLSGQQIVLAGHIVAPKSDYKDSGNSITVNPPGLPLTGPNSDGGETGFVPNFYWAAAFDNGLHFGVGVNVPFGLATEYDAGWVGRYHALKSEITTININPAIAWKVTDKVSLGIGLSYQYIDVELTNNIDSAAACGGLAANFGGVVPGGIDCTGLIPGTASQDSGLKLEGDDSSFGWNIGFLFDISDKDRLGIAYRSEIKHDIGGNATYNLESTLSTAATDVTNTIGFLVFQNTALSALASLPETFSLSYVHDLNVKWSFLADYTWTGWSSIDTVEVVLANGAPGLDPGLELAFRNTNRLAIGAHYKPGNDWIFRGGLAYDETPVRSPEQRSARIPDNDRTWLSLGLGYAPSKSWSFDLAYSHLFVDDTPINNSSRASSGATLIGTYEASVDILSAGVNFNF